MLLYLAARLYAKPGFYPILASFSHSCTCTAPLLMTPWLIFRLRSCLLIKHHRVPVSSTCLVIYGHHVPVKPQLVPPAIPALMPLCVLCSLSFLSGELDRRCKRSPLYSWISTRYVTVPLSQMSEIERGDSPLETLCQQHALLTQAISTLQESYFQLEGHIQSMASTSVTSAPAAAPGPSTSERTLSTSTVVMPPPEPRVPALE